MQIADRFWFVFPWLASLALQLPFFVLAIVGAIFAVSRWQRHPRVSLYATVSIGISTIWTLISSLLNLLVPAYLANSLVAGSFSMTQLSYVYFAISLVSGLIHAATFGLLLLAVFSDRPQNRHKPPPEFK